MSFSTGRGPTSVQQARYRGYARQRACALAAGILVAALVLAGCGQRADLGTTGAVSGFVGAVASDEPRASLVAREVLSAGGSAADAAVALYFAAAVTYPAAASLGGGGTCLVHDGPSRATEALQFLAAAPEDGGGQRPFAVPGNVRGMFALHGKYGRLPWGQLLSPAEQLARFGHRASRALVRDLAIAGPDLLADPEARRAFGDTVPAEGALIVQLDLAATLTQIRTAGAGDFYTGALARRLAAGARGAGGRLGEADLRAYLPVWKPTVRVAWGNYSLHANPLPTTGGMQFAAAWQMLTGDRHYRSAAAEERSPLLAEAGQRLLADRETWLRFEAFDRPVLALPEETVLDGKRLSGLLAANRAEPRAPGDGRPAAAGMPENPAAMSFTVVDQAGSAVACTVSLNNLFGTGRMAPGTGIVLAAAPTPRRGSPLSSTQALLVNHNVNDVYVAAAASGGVAAPMALLQTLLPVLVDDSPLAAAVAKPRIQVDPGTADLVVVEAGLPAAEREALTRRGHRLREVLEIGRVNAIRCPGGARQKGRECTFASDGRGFGLATGG